MQLDGKSWFVLADGKISGPFTPEVVRSMKKRGRIHRDSELSVDRRTWISASAFRELFVEDQLPIESALPSTPATVAEIQYFYHDDGNSAGPVSFEKLKELSAAGSLAETDLIWFEGASKWFPASSLNGLSFPTEKELAFAWLNKNRAKACFIGATILVLLFLPSWYVIKLNFDRTQAAKDKQIMAEVAQITAKRKELRNEEEDLAAKMEDLKKQEEEALQRIENGPAARQRHADIVREIATRRNEIIANEDAQRAEPIANEDAQRAEPIANEDAQRAEPIANEDAQRAEPIANEDAQRAEPIADLYDLVSTGTVSLVHAQGNGASSGNSVDAVLRNNTEGSIDVHVYMRRPLFLRNSGAGQNMIACMLVGADLKYRVKGVNSVVTLNPNENFNSSMVAYCVDFEKDNPTESDSFAVNESPSNLAPVMARINEYVRVNPKADVTKAAQVAVWLAQGIDLDEIEKKYKFTSADAALADSFLQ